MGSLLRQNNVNRLSLATFVLDWAIISYEISRSVADGRFFHTQRDTLLHYCCIEYRSSEVCQGWMQLNVAFIGIPWCLYYLWFIFCVQYSITFKINQSENFVTLCYIYVTLCSIILIITYPKPTCKYIHKNYLFKFERTKLFIEHSTIGDIHEYI